MHRPAITMGAVRAVLLAVSASGAVGAALARAGVFDQLPLHKPLRSIKSRLNRKPKVVVQRKARVTPVRPAAEGAQWLHARLLIGRSPQWRCRHLPRRSRQVSRRSRQPPHAVHRRVFSLHFLTQRTLLSQAHRKEASLCSQQSIRWYARIASHVGHSARRQLRSSRGRSCSSNKMQSLLRRCLACTCRRSLHRSCAVS